MLNLLKIDTLARHTGQGVYTKTYAVFLIPISTDIGEYRLNVFLRYLRRQMHFTNRLSADLIKVDQVSKYSLKTEDT